MNKTGLRDDATWPPSSWNGGRDQIGIGGRLRRNPQTTPVLRAQPAALFSRFPCLFDLQLVM